MQPRQSDEKEINLAAVEGKAGSRERSRITTDPDLFGGIPCIRGMRFPASQVLWLLAAGQTPEEILAQFPFLEAEDLSAALEFAAAVLDGEEELEGIAWDSEDTVEA